MTGYADINHQQWTDEKISYHLFSVTKTFTALALVQLAEKKKLDIDEPAIKYIPGFRYLPEITIRQLLTHTAGIPNPIPLKWIHLAEEHAAFDRKRFLHRTNKYFLK